jgi:hypothetical protein
MGHLSFESDWKSGEFGFIRWENCIEKKECVGKTHDRSETFVLQENQNIVNYH